jgi:cytosine/adenosine deaminase-related metal-dependent hydrolase
MLKTGCTTAYDLFMSIPFPAPEDMEAVVRAYDDVGLRVVLAPAVGDLRFWDTVPDLLALLPPSLGRRLEDMGPPGTDDLLRLGESSIRRFHGAAGGRVRLALAPTIPTQCTDEFLTGCARQAREHGVGIHTHLAESKVQAIAAMRRWGKTAVARLAELGMLGPGFVGAHGVWLTEDDIGRLGDAGAAISHNPASNLRLGSGIAAVREMLDRGVTVALGCDGSMSSDNQNLFEAMRMAGLVGNVRFPHHTARWLEKADVWRMATLNGARALGLGGEVGAIEPGRLADLALLRSNSTYLSPRSDVLGSLVYVETGASVDTVLVGGKVLLRGGRVLTVDEDRLRTRAQTAADGLRARRSFALAARWRRTRGLPRSAVTPYPVNRYAAPVA